MSTMPKVLGIIVCLVKRWGRLARGAFAGGRFLAGVFGEAFPVHVEFEDLEARLGFGGWAVAPGLVNRPL